MASEPAAAVRKRRYQRKCCTAATFRHRLNRPAKPFTRVRIPSLVLLMMPLLLALMCEYLRR
jgi:hypothetical protein